MVLTNIFITERYTEIERENRILLEKMTTIMAQKPKVPDCNHLIELMIFSLFTFHNYA